MVAFEVFDFETNRWRCLPDVPSKRVFALYTHSDTHIFSVGGLNQDPKLGFSDVTEVFDLETGILIYIKLFSLSAVVFCDNSCHLLKPFSSAQRTDIDAT